MQTVNSLNCPLLTTLPNQTSDKQTIIVQQSFTVFYSSQTLLRLFLQFNSYSILREEAPNPNHFQKFCWLDICWNSSREFDPGILWLSCQELDKDPVKWVWPRTGQEPTFLHQKSRKTKRTENCDEVRGWEHGVEFSKIGVWGDLSTGAGGTEENRERMGVVSYPADQSPTMGCRDTGAHTRMPPCLSPCPLHDSHRRQASCHHHLSITP